MGLEHLINEWSEVFFAALGCVTAVCLPGSCYAGVAVAGGGVGVGMGCGSHPRTPGNVLCTVRSRILRSCASSDLILLTLLGLPGWLMGIWGLCLTGKSASPGSKTCLQQV